MASADDFKSLQTSSEESFLFECSPCENSGKKTEAKYFCPECEDYLCSSCNMFHQNLSVTRKHQVVSGTLMHASGKVDKGQVRVQCSCNYGEVTFYCREHKNVICVQCKMMQHRYCESMTIAEACDSMEITTADSTQSRMKHIVQKLETLQKTRKEDIDRLTAQTVECRDMVNLFMKELIQHIKEMGNQSLNDIKKWDDEQRDTIQQHIDICYTAIDRLNMAFRQFDAARTSGDKRLIFIRNLKLSATMDSVHNILENVEKEVKQPSIYFACDKTLKQPYTKRLGVVGSTLCLNEQQPCFTNMSVVTSKQVDVSFSKAETPRIYGSIFMPSGELVMCDGLDNSIMVLHLDFTLKEIITLKSYPWDVSVMNTVEIVVSLPSSRMLQFIKALPKLQLGSSIDLDQECRGVAVKDEMIYVSFIKYGEIMVLDRAGQKQKNIYSSFHFSQPYYISFSQTETLCISEYSTNTLRVYNNGKEMYSYNNAELNCPRGMYIDNKENILVCGLNSNNVHLVDNSGQLIKILLSKSDGLNQPCTVSFRPSDNTLVVAGLCQTLVVCKLG